MALILRYFTESNSVAFGADYVRVVEDRPILIVWDKSVAQRIQFFFGDISFIFAEVTENEYIIDEHVRNILHKVRDSP